MIRTTVRRALLAGAALTVALTLSACGGDDHDSPMHDTAGSGTTTAPADGGPTAGAAPFGDADVMFAQMMIPHHQQAVEMADLAATRAADPEVKSLAADIKAAQGPEIDAMSGWLTTWGRPVPSPGAEMPHMDHAMPGMMSDADMAGLTKASGRDFDRKFLTMMIAHHEGAIEMARSETATGTSPEAKAMAQQIATSQQKEIALMRGILDRL
ncbi:Uncharacterized conserved protein, DUF305 family [Micromonospora nigra]|uniref:Uncharacterized conserved protein, DUF305 family n=1 Tax=Micromonospora nigra TaxID=145857 RepID=A0A1C6S7D7_9ACTN|nr:DUF305 domain-containing protein [Micromonospora nigra]SCL25207.1 Uncharacterized conserved protein, DUF305 family [Micromonospora nigra]